MLYSDEDKTRVLVATDVVALISEQVPLKRVGRRYVGLCPFHSEGTPSFSVNQEQGLYYCFGCHASGDSISFVMNSLRIDFQEALEHLARRAGIRLNPIEGTSAHSRSKRETHLAYLAKASDFFQKNLQDPLVGAAARDYLKERGISPEAVKHFGLGWTPDSGKSYRTSLGASEEDFVEIGLGYKDDRGRVHDHFRGRIMFPITDTTSRVVGFGGRILPDVQDRTNAQLPKYKNSPETYLYQKRRVLYGLDQARAKVVALGEVVVCDGYTDVIGFWQAGVDNAVATCGTALSDEHFERLKNFARRIVLSFDADNAGQDAAERLYKLEQRFSLQIFVAQFPFGKDPSEIAKQNPQLLPDVINNAIPFLKFRLMRLFNRADLSSSESRARTAESAIAMLLEHPNPLVRSDYLGFISDYTKISLSQLRRRIDANPRANFAGTRGVASIRLDDQGDPSDRAALEALRHLVHDPGKYSAIILPELFRSSQMARLASIANKAQGTKEIPELLVNDQELFTLFYRLASGPPTTEALDVLSTFVVSEASFELERISQRLKQGLGNLANLAALSSEISVARGTIEKVRNGEDVTINTGKLIRWLVKERSNQ